MSTANALERQMLDLINDERTSRGLEPLTLALKLNDSSEDHSSWMLQSDVFSHTGVNGSSSGDRMRDAGYTFSGSWSSGENIAWQSERGAPGLSDDVINLHEALMNSPGHRANILSSGFEHIGIGIETGNFKGYDAVMVTQNFARTSASVALDQGGSNDPEPSPPADDGNGAITGTNGADNLLGGAGDDVIRGLAGNDWITPGEGADTVDGGSGSDMISFIDLDDRVTVKLDERSASAGGDTKRLVDVENVTGSSQSDYIEGDAGANQLRGMGGYDWFVGSDGGDSYEGGDGRDMISYIEANGGVGVDLGAQKGLAGQAAGDTYNSVERATGSSFSDLFYGSNGEDEFRGMGGYDWFVGSSGGRDRYDGGSGRDTVAYTESSSGVNASLALGYGSRGDAARDLYTSIESLTGSNHDDNLTGNNDRNILRGMYGEDVLKGNGGVDYLEGGGSDDVLYGGDGWDVAMFEEARSEYDIFTDGDMTSVSYRRGGGEGTDLLFEIEAIQFADDMVYL